MYCERLEQLLFAAASISSKLRNRYNAGLCGGRLMQHKPWLGLAASALLLAVLSPYPAFAEETKSKEIVAAKVRKQGYACEAPKSISAIGKYCARRDGWMLECQNANYR